MAEKLQEAIENDDAKSVLIILQQNNKLETNSESPIDASLPIRVVLILERESQEIPNKKRRRKLAATFIVINNWTFFPSLPRPWNQFHDSNKLQHIPDAERRAGGRGSFRFH